MLAAICIANGAEPIAHIAFMIFLFNFKLDFLNLRLDFPLK